MSTVDVRTSKTGSTYITVGGWRFVVSADGERAKVLGPDRKAVLSQFNPYSPSHNVVLDAVKS